MTGAVTPIHEIVTCISNQPPRPPHGETEITTLINYAKHQKKGDWHVYTRCKHRLGELRISSEQYERTHRRLINILRV